MADWQRQIKDALKRAFFRLYRFGTRLGVHVLPVHYYSAEPNVVQLAKTMDLWVRPSEMPGIEVDLDEQIRNLREMCLPFQAEYAGNATYRAACRAAYGPGFGFVEAQLLHAVLRHVKPSRLIEIGSGVSTYCAATALKMNETRDHASWELTCIEPHPSAALRRLAQTEPRVRLLAHPVQAVPMSVFGALSSNDVLFVDSSHVVKAGSDVNHIILEILPRLKRGVLVHFHDIYFPYDYQRDVLETFLHNNETALLRAFLIFNRRFRFLFCLSHLHYERTAQVQAIFPDYRPQPGRFGLRNGRPEAGTHFPSSTWLRVLE